MTGFEKELREALALLSRVPVAGMEERLRMCKAEEKILVLANKFARLEKEGKLRINMKEDKPNDEAGNEQGNV